MTLHLVRIGVHLRALAHYATARRIEDADYGYALHCALLARFGTAAPRPFRFLPEHARGAHLLGYTDDATAFADAAALPAVDDLLATLFDGSPQFQPMPETWRSGARYGFELRVRPVVRFGKTIRAARRDRPDAWQRHAGEIDAHVAACERVVLAGGVAEDVDRETVYIDWLAGRLGEAATLDHAALRLFRRTATRRSTHGASDKRTRAVEGPDAVLAGTLTIGDAERFAQLLARGVGRHSAFGYGMMLLAPPGRGG